MRPPPQLIVTATDRLELVRKMGLLITAGVSLRETLAIVGSGTQSGSSVALLRTVRKQVEAGKSLTDSLASSSPSFGADELSMIRVGESSGQLGKALQRLGEHMGRREMIRAKIRSALVYPLIVVSVAVAALLFLLIFIVPVFADMYRDYDRTLPDLTLAVLRISQWVTDDAWMYALASLAAVFLIRQTGGLPIRWRTRLDEVWLGFPLIGSLVRLSVNTTYFRSVQFLLENGVGLLEANRLSAQGVRNRHASKVYGRIEAPLTKGRSWSDGLLKTGFVSTDAVQMIRVGESTGDLAASARFAADLYESELSRQTDRLLVFLEPAIILTLGGFVAFVLIAMYLPMMEVVVL